MSFVHEKGGLQGAVKGEGTTINYNGGVVSKDGSGGSVFDKQNKIKYFQRVFQSGHEPVHMKLPRDRIIVKGMLVGSLFSLAICFSALAQMSLPKKN